MDIRRGTKDGKNEANKGEGSSGRETEESGKAGGEEQRDKGKERKGKTAVKPATVREMRDENRWRQIVLEDVQFYNAEGEWEHSNSAETVLEVP
jgi:hypothetical protein